MAAFSTAVVSARTTSGCTITFNAASIDCTTAQLRQLQTMIQRLVVDTTGSASVGTPATITIGGQS